MKPEERIRARLGTLHNGSCGGKTVRLRDCGSCRLALEALSAIVAQRDELAEALREAADYFEDEPKPSWYRKARAALGRLGNG